MNINIKEAWDRLTPAERKELEKLLAAKTLPNFIDPQFALQNNFISDLIDLYQYYDNEDKMNFVKSILDKLTNQNKINKYWGFESLLL